MGSSISEEQVALLQSACPVLRFVTVLMDGDEPGRAAGEKVGAAVSRHWWARIATLSADTQPDTVGEKELMALMGR
jgi:DNA primase